MNKYQRALNKLTGNVLKLDKIFDTTTMDFKEIRSFYKKTLKNKGIDGILNCNKNVLRRLKYFNAANVLANAGKGKVISKSE